MFYGFPIPRCVDESGAWVWGATDLFYKTCSDLHVVSGICFDLNILDFQTSPFEVCWA